jgi:mannan endo-1,4-beta-mannosidase
MSNVLRVLRRASILFTLLLLPIASFAGFSISNGQLVDNNGTPFIMRGVNYPYTWFQSRNTQADLAAIAATGSNTVRIVLATGGQWARNNGTQVAQLIQWCKDLKMIAVLEVHRLHRLERADDRRADLESPRPTGPARTSAPRSTARKTS